MATLERRIAALEMKARGSGAFKVVIVQMDETEQQALHRYGITDDTIDVVFILRFGPTTAIFENRLKNPL